LRSIISRKVVPDFVPSWSKRICALVISRLLWDLREMRDASTPDVLGLSSLSDSHKAALQSLLGSLMALNDSLTTPTCTYDVVNMK
ncbi:hypothetical protein, partial [Metapseudomonas otitidis]|uniref:hypothetical protein n=1 Tax=Metapseudomonas otitidis TaxID=319939 RepID=UPI001F28DC5A